MYMDILDLFGYINGLWFITFTRSKENYKSIERYLTIVGII